MKKIGFVIIDFGDRAQGGEVFHGRMLAERLRPYYNVEILTSTNSGIDGERYPEGVSSEKGLTIRRFNDTPVDPEHKRIHARKAKGMRRLRYYLGRLGLLGLITKSHPEWKAGQKADIKYLKAQNSHKSGLLQYLALHGKEYDALLFINMYNSSTVLGCMTVPEKSILIPLAHPTRALYNPVFSSLFTRVRHIAFNAAAEQRMCRRVFGPHMAPNSVVGVGIELDPAAQWETVKEKYNLPEGYILYLGRITKSKIGSLIPDFRRYRDKYNPDAKLVLAGGGGNKINFPDDPSVIFTGFVTGEEKTAVIQHATLMVNPSTKESLSLLMLESMANGIPVIVNGKSEVMRDHCLASGAAFYYDNPKDFRRKLHRLLTDGALRKEMGGKGMEYVRTHYDWDVIIGKLRTLIDNL